MNGSLSVNIHSYLFGVKIATTSALFLGKSGELPVWSDDDVKKYTDRKN